MIAIAAVLMTNGTGLSDGTSAHHGAVQSRNDRVDHQMLDVVVLPGPSYAAARGRFSPCLPERTLMVENARPQVRRCGDCEVSFPP